MRPSPNTGYTTQQPRVKEKHPDHKKINIMQRTVNIFPNLGPSRF